jgi:hypothetical protein
MKRTRTYSQDKYVQERVQQLKEMHVVHKTSLKKIEKELDDIQGAYNYG